MKLVGLVAIACWYMGATYLRRNQVAAGWQMRCLNCGETSPLTRAGAIRGMQSGDTKYSLDECPACRALVGVAIESKAEDALVA